MGHSLLYALRTITPTFGVADDAPDHQKLYWFQDVQRRDVREYLEALKGLSEDQVLQEMVYEWSGPLRRAFSLTRQAKVLAYGAGPWGPRASPRPRAPAGTRGDGMVGSQLRFVASAYRTAQGMIRFADQKAEMLFVISGILLALMSGRVTLLLFCAFLGLMFCALSFAVTTMHPRFAPREDPDAGGRRRLYWCHDVLGRDREAYLAAVRGLSDEEVLEEMAHELYDVQAIERAKFAEVSRAIRLSAWGLAVWALTFILTFTV